MSRAYRRQSLESTRLAPVQIAFLIAKSIPIIGAGMAGLSAGCCSQMNGYRTSIYELHALPGRVCTTWERYIGNRQGSFQGWRETAESLRMRLDKSLPGLKGFCMAGQWVEPGGSIPTAVVSGRNVTQLICRRDKKAFGTSKPKGHIVITSASTQTMEPSDQYSLVKILGLWAAATVTMALLSWVAYPLVAPDRASGPLAAGITRVLLAGLIWQFVLSMIVVRREEGDSQWAMVKRRLRREAPRDPKSGERRHLLWLWIVPALVAVALLDMCWRPRSLGAERALVRADPWRGVGPGIGGRRERSEPNR